MEMLKGGAIDGWACFVQELLRDKVLLLRLEKLLLRPGRKEDLCSSNRQTTLGSSGTFFRTRAFYGEEERLI